MLTRRPHVAGSEANAEAAAYVLSTLTSYNIPSHTASYDTALTYPVSRSLVLTRPSPDPPIKFSLQQEVYEGDPYADVANEVQPTYHAYAKSGTAVGPVVYVNYGRVEDYATLKEMGVNVSGNVVLARYGEIYRGDIVENAYEEGAIGVLIFTDRKDYGGGGADVKWFPDDKWMPPSGVQVGSVYNGAGDPTTPGWPSTEGCERLSDEEVERAGDVPLIPSLPISWADGDAIVRSIGGQVASDAWQGGKDAPVYRVGPGPGIVNLTYNASASSIGLPDDHLLSFKYQSYYCRKGKQVLSRIENVVGIIEGAEEPDRFVILGNHRDAWTFGAVDPNSGTACLLEVAERLWKLQKKGWKPRRTIIFCNWDAEEYGLIGSTEWVEENRQMLASRVVAYLNVDIAVGGAGFRASATPQLDELLIQAAKQVRDPDNSSQTVYDSWISSTDNPAIGRLGGAGSDYSAFVQHIGVPAADISFGEDYPVYHSMYDDFIWMNKFGDPMFQRHVAVASIWGLLALELADNEILPFDYLPYARELQRSVESLKDEVVNRGITLVPLLKSIKELETAATKINEERKIYAPSKHNDYGSTSFPGIDDAVEKAKNLNTADSWNSVQHEIWRVARVITQASLCLKGDGCCRPESRRPYLGSNVVPRSGWAITPITAQIWVCDDKRRWSVQISCGEVKRGRDGGKAELVRRKQRHPAGRVAWGRQ
ncbi:putative glutamate carboxypeptidase LAMP1 [Sesamum angolense]|uniref:glutamate carboxypeptidase II n=1 Tax=Sesamum angolense TaxID=2727404 RepID=A0AAE1WP03_9LAMI|nr:putative glutamate carboxypeptidase LAMP1 [Sesamum angolense]